MCRRTASNSGWPGVTHSRLFVVGRLAVGGSRGYFARATAAASPGSARSSGAPSACGRIEGVRERRHGLEGERRRTRPRRTGSGRWSRGRRGVPVPCARRSISISRLSFLVQAFQRVLADGPELVFVHVAQQPVFEVGVAKLAGVVVAQDALDLGGGQNLADDVEDRVVVRGRCESPAASRAAVGARGLRWCWSRRS